MLLFFFLIWSRQYSLLLKNASAILLLFIFSFNSIGFYLSVGIQLYQNKEEMKRNIIAGTPDGDLISLLYNSETKELFKWHGKREFRHKELMYDVVRAERKGDAVIYYCIADDEETLLLAMLIKQLKKNSKRHKRGGKTTKNLHKVFFLTRSFSEKLVLQKKEEKHNITSGTLELYTPPGLEFAGPPPKIV